MTFRARPKIGFLPIGHHRYCPQFPNLRDRALRMCKRLEEMIKGYAEIVKLLKSNPRYRP